MPWILLCLVSLSLYRRWFDEPEPHRRADYCLSISRLFVSFELGIRDSIVGL
uniref:Uncharacterized protein n=1 Tax=Arundo donax TaxID=35708 RepID=A0A0A8XYH9_ARUDO